MGHVQKKVRVGADGKEYTRYQARWIDPATGKLRAKRFTAKKAAETWLRRIELAAATGEPPEPAEPDGQTVAEYLTRWVDTTVVARLNAGTWSPTHAAGVEANVRVHLIPRLGHLRLNELDVEHVEEDLIDGMVADGLAPGTARKVRSTLSRALTDARRRKLVRVNVAREAEPPALETPEPSAFTTDELGQIIKVWDRSRYRLLFEFLLYSGLRISEARGLRWDNVDLDGGTYQLQRGLHIVSRTSADRLGIVDHRAAESGAKTKASKKRTDLGRAAIELLRSHRQAQLETRMAAASWGDPTLVWTTTSGQPINPPNVRRSWRSILNEANVTAEHDGRLRGPQELRRTFLARLRDAGVPIEDAQRLGRWASPNVLLVHYATSSTDRLRAAAEKAAAPVG